MNNTPSSPLFPLFQHMNDVHCLTLVDSELTEIVRVVEGMENATLRQLESELTKANRAIALATAWLQINRPDVLRQIEEAIERVKKTEGLCT